jgi:hypothetical protein
MCVIEIGSNPSLINGTDKNPVPISRTESTDYMCPSSGPLQVYRDSLLENIQVYTRTLTSANQKFGKLAMLYCVNDRYQNMIRVFYAK